MGGDWHDLGGGLTEGSDASVSLQPLARIDDRRARLGGRLDRRDPDARRHDHHAGGQGAYLDGADLARLRAGRGTHHHRPAVLLQSNDLKQALALLRRRAPMAGCSTPRPNISAKPMCRRSRPRAVGTGAAPPCSPICSTASSDRLDGRRRCSSSTKAGWRSTTRASPASSANG
jgi:hypothetical protein